MTEPTDLTSTVLEQIRDELRGHTRILTDHTRILADHTRILTDHTHQFETLNVAILGQGERQDGFETVLRDLAEQMVMLTRAVKVSLGSRADVDTTLETHDRRISALERRQGPGSSGRLTGMQHAPGSDDTGAPEVLF